jgi:hypothetical protein
MDIIPVNTPDYLEKAKDQLPPKNTPQKAVSLIRVIA